MIRSLLLFLVMFILLGFIHDLILKLLQSLLEGLHFLNGFRSGIVVVFSFFSKLLSLTGLVLYRLGEHRA